jgi:tRNA nucleotidyltransferase (CCA-adding enzyme)
MEIILTHEQADFDAVGALLASHLLSEHAIPVLPNKVNRNVRKFINLYSSELPFVENKFLPEKPVQSVFLVDTQSLVTVKRPLKNMSVHVVDHHQERPDLSPLWTKTIEKTGATTTLLVEQLAQNGSGLSTIHATLMLLGVYEDTGSLTYASTTIRDLKAVTYLMEQGANLGIASDYLNPALTDSQRALTERLLANAQTISIQGKTILISKAEALEMNEEVSSIAHKIRDLLDPDALFLLVRNEEGIRLVARSTTDDIDVSKIALEFGGGGHQRAAAALIHMENVADGESDTKLDSIPLKIIELLRSNIKPAVTVGKIMSKQPLLITPNTSMEDAASLMNRYGYEGYPVVDKGIVVGLLTRRSLDRAVTHKLNLTAASIMDAGDYSLTPDQTLQDLQDLMASTGWGQIPIIDPVSKTIIGIVTRTDLLKNLAGLEPVRLHAINYATMVKSALSAGRFSLLEKIIDISNQTNQPIYVVGGFVRDLILQTPSKDFDIVVEGDAFKIAQILAETFGGRVIRHKRFSTAKWQIKGIKEKLFAQLGCSSFEPNDLPDTLDLVSARTEFYDYPTALPTVERSSIKLDLHRRDFTINTLALRLDGKHFGELYDYWGGLNDIQKKRVRVLHSLSFVDDPTRILRAVRFEQRFGFRIEDRTLQLMMEAKSMLRRVSGDRIRHEFELLFNEKDPIGMMQRMVELELLQHIHPSLHWNEDCTEPFRKILTGVIPEEWDLPLVYSNQSIFQVLKWIVWLCINDSNTVGEITGRLRLSSDLKKCILASAGLLASLNEFTDKKPSEITTALDSVPVISLYAVFCVTQNKQVLHQIERYIKDWRHIHPHTTGETLRAMGILPGPVYAKTLRELRSAWVDGQVKSLEEEQALLNSLVLSTGL